MGSLEWWRTKAIETMELLESAQDMVTRYQVMLGQRLEPEQAASPVPEAPTSKLNNYVEDYGDKEEPVK